jgi:hypothetical protein
MSEFSLQAIKNCGLQDESNERNNITRIERATYCIWSTPNGVVTHHYTSIESNGRDDARSRNAGQPPVKGPAVKNQALGSALIRADKRDSLRLTVLA